MEIAKVDMNNNIDVLKTMVLARGKPFKDIQTDKNV